MRSDLNTVREQGGAAAASTISRLSLSSPHVMSCTADEEEIDFEGFIKIMRAGSVDSLDHLDQYDARLSTVSSPSRKSLPDLIDE